MYELNRARLFRVGPRAARYTDVTLDLSDVGAVVPIQGSLFAAAVRRPSPSTLLLLENGGGKSVLLRLLFSVVLPGRRNAVGTSAAVMDQFVIGDDTAHVVLEWMNVRTGDRVITGKTLQRRRSSSAGERLAEHWWSLRPHDDVGIDSLPLTSDGRHLRLEAFREALQEVNHRAPVTQLNWVGSEVGEWSRHLRDIGIDPDLFGIQRRMNDDEGDAGNAFKFSSSKDFVDWLLEVVLDPEDATIVAGNFDSYATTVGDRNAMILERQFVAGAVDTLTPVATAWLRATAARSARAATELWAAGLLRDVEARIAVEHSDRANLQGKAAAARTIATAATTDRDRARDVTNEIRRLTLVLEVAAAEKEGAAATNGRNDAAAELRGWAVADLLERRAGAEADAAQLADRVVDAENAALPALKARDAAAAGLLTKLEAEAGVARAEQATHEAAAKQCSDDAASADSARSAALLQTQSLVEDQKQISRVVTKLRARIESAVAQGLLSAGQDVAQAAQDATDVAVKAATRLVAAQAALHHATTDALRLARVARDAHDLHGAARSAHNTSVGAFQQVHDQAAQLAADEIVMAALTTDMLTVEQFDASADAVTDLLATDETSRTRQLAELTAAQLEDQRLLDALGEGGFLPARDAVQKSVDLLATAGVVAHSGWRYLTENVPAGERTAVIEHHPELVDGVVVIDPAALSPARALLAAARLLPSAAIAVGPGARMLTDPTSPDRDEYRHSVDDNVQRGRDYFVIEPNPALFDSDAAERRRLDVRTQMDNRGTEIASAAALLGLLREVSAELTVWRRACPPGRLAELAAAADATQIALDEAACASSFARVTATAADTERARLDEELPALTSAERSAADRAGALGRLAAEAIDADEQRRRLPELEEHIAAARLRSEALTTTRDRAQQRAVEEARLAENSRDRAGRHIADMREVTSSTGARASTVPTAGVSALRAVYLAAARTYAAVEVGHDLRAEAERAEQAAAQLRSEVAGRNAADVVRGEILLASSDGANPVSRHAAEARAERRRLRFETEIGAALTQVGSLGAELRTATPSDGRNVWIGLPEELRPTSVENSRNLRELAAFAQRSAQRYLDDVSTEESRLDQLIVAATESARAFGEVLAPLAAALEYSSVRGAGNVEEGQAPYPGDAEHAAADSATVREELLRTTKEDADATKDVMRVVDAVKDFAQRPEFESMTNVARRALMGLERDQIAARAAEFAGQLAQRLATLNSDLESASRHRKLIVERLSALVDGALRTLRTASRLSKLPAGLGDWEGKEFLRIRFAEPDPSLLAARIGEVVDEIAATMSERTARATAKRDGLTLLLRSVEAAVPKGFTVDVLKPDAVLRDERVPVESMGEVFSGGQELTAAIVLYCTLAALRANERGQLRSRHSGVLFLDNPIGKASAEYLLELQQGVAAALGVQLVYTTGLSDDRALAAFPLWVRMRNDKDLRAGLKHIRVAEVVRRQLPEPFSDEDAAPSGTAPGTVTATRVYRRPS